jgi:hypothetical protein
LFVVVVDVFTRKVSARPMKMKTARAALQALEFIRGGGPKAPVPLSSLSTDTGGEFAGCSTSTCTSLGLFSHQKGPRHKDGTAVVDAAIARLKIIIGKELEETRSHCWVRVLPEGRQRL